MIILGLKEHQIEAALDGILSMVGPETVFVTTQNVCDFVYTYRLHLVLFALLGHSKEHVYHIHIDYI